MSTYSKDDSLDAEVAKYLKTCGRPVDIEKVVKAFPKFSAFEVKEAVWRLLDQHEAALTEQLKIVAVA